LNPSEQGPLAPVAETGYAVRKRVRMIALAVIVVVAAAVVMLIAWTNNRDSGPVDGALYAGLERGYTGQGLPRLGSPDAPVTVTEFASFGCGHCARFHEDTYPVFVSEEVRRGEASLVFVPYSNPDSPAIVLASAAAFCAGEQSKFWEMHDELFAGLQREAGAAYRPERLQEYAGAVGLDINAFESCMDADSTIDWLNDANNLFMGLVQEYPGEVTGTPTIVINGVPPLLAEGQRSGAVSIGKLRDLIDEYAR
jgi:protein-disulfide isomerase